jgi:hypothetical protein
MFPICLSSMPWRNISLDEIWLHSLWTPSLNGGENLALCFSCFIPQGKIPGFHLIGGWGGPVAAVGLVLIRKLSPCQEFNLSCLAKASHFTDFQFAVTLVVVVVVISTITIAAAVMITYYECIIVIHICFMEWSLSAEATKCLYSECSEVLRWRLFTKNY